jgi:hypothetical protein
MASEKPKVLSAYPVWFAQIFGGLVLGVPKEIGLYPPTPEGRRGVLNQQRLVRQYRASLRKYPTHPHAELERQYKIVAEVRKLPTGWSTVNLIAHPKQSPTEEVMASWHNSIV